MKLFLHRTQDIKSNKTTLPEPLKPATLHSSPAIAYGAMALGALAIGALAIGTLAIGRLVLGKLSIGQAHIKKLEIDDLIVKKGSSLFGVGSSMRSVYYSTILTYDNYPDFERF